MKKIETFHIIFKYYNDIQDKSIIKNHNRISR